MNYEDLIKIRLNSIYGIYGIHSCCKTQQEMRLAKDESTKEIIRNEIRTLKILKGSRSKLNF